MPTSNDSILREYVRYLNSIFNLLISRSRLVLVRHEPPLFIVSCFQNKEFLPLKLKPTGWLHFRQYASIQSGQVVVEDCRYIYYPSSNPPNEHEWLVRYEYSLNPPEKVPYSHLHVNMSKGGRPFRDIHFPTGRVSIEQIIAHLIIEHGIQPMKADWLERLTESHRGFMERRTDPQSQQFP